MPHTGNPQRPVEPLTACACMTRHKPSLFEPGFDLAVEPCPAILINLLLARICDLQRAPWPVPLGGELFSGFFYGPNQIVVQFYGIPGFNDQSVAESTRAYILADYQVLPNWRVEATVQNTENDKLTFDTNNGAVTPTFGFIGAEGTPQANTILITANSADATGTVQQYTIRNLIELAGPG